MNSKKDYLNWLSMDFLSEYPQLKSEEGIQKTFDLWAECFEEEQVTLSELSNVLKVWKNCHEQDEIPNVFHLLKLRKIIFNAPKNFMDNVLEYKNWIKNNLMTVYPDPTLDIKSYMTNIIDAWAMDLELHKISFTELVEALKIWRLGPHAGYMPNAANLIEIVKNKKAKEEGRGLKPGGPVRWAKRPCNKA